MEKTEIVMDYEKEYKAVLKTATQWIKDGCTDKEKICLECVFPELRESEDERIRKELIEFIQWSEDRGTTRHDFHQRKRPGVWLAWLEKQKEQKFCSDAPKEKSVGGDFLSSHKDKNLDEIAQDYVDGVKEYNPEPTWNLMQTAVCYGYHLAEQKEKKPADRFEEAREKYQVEWSEEDEMVRNAILGFLNPDKGGTKYSSHAELVEWNNWLKSLRPSWKPNEEQIHSLGTVVKGYNECTVGSVGYHLKEMYEQLKKLM